MKSSLIVASAALSLIALIARAEEPASAGRAAFERVCEECHYEDDFVGNSRQEILGLIEQVSAGDIEHELDLSGLSQGEATGLAGFYASFE
jgi:cytochrome c2